MKILKVSGGSNVSSVSGSIIKSIEEGNKVELRAIGASAVNQTVKAIANAQGILATKGIIITTMFGFQEVKSDIEGAPKITAMSFRIIVNE